MSSWSEERPRSSGFASLQILVLTLIIGALLSGTAIYFLHEHPSAPALSAEVPPQPVAQPITSPSSSSGSKAATEVAPAQKPASQTGVDDSKATEERTGKARGEGAVVRSNSSIYFAVNDDDAFIDAYDGQGRHTGVLRQAGQFIRIEEDIPDSTYDLFGANVFILYPLGVNGRIQVSAKREAKISITVFIGDNGFLYVTDFLPSSIALIPVIFSTSTKRADIGPLILDKNGDGTFDGIIHGQAF